MLVLSRKKNESIVIDDRITIIIVDIRGDKVRLGIDAPKDVSVHRQEVFEAIQGTDSAIKEHSDSEEKPRQRRKSTTALTGACSESKNNKAKAKTSRTSAKEAKTLVTE